MGPLAIAGIGLGTSLLNKLLAPGARPGMVDPRAYRSDIVPNLSVIRQGARRGVSQQIMPMQAQIRQYGAANRLPAGAVLSSLSGLGYQAGRGLAQIEPELAMLKSQGMMNYLDYLNQFEAAKEGARRENIGRFNLTPEIGSLTQLLMLHSAGLLGGNNSQNPNYKANLRDIRNKWTG